MALSKQAKVLNSRQISMVRSHLRSRRNGLRNDLIFLLSVKAGLRAKEISQLSWIHVLGSDGIVGDVLGLTDIASKGRSGREIPIHKDIKIGLSELLKVRLSRRREFDPSERVISTERSAGTTPQVIVNFFARLYSDLGLVGCSSHSGRRTFITDCSRRISSVGGSLRDIQQLAGHSSLQTTQRYIEGSTESKTRLIGLI